MSCENMLNISKVYSANSFFINFSEVRGINSRLNLRDNCKKSTKYLSCGKCQLKHFSFDGERYINRLVSHSICILERAREREGGWEEGIARVWDKLIKYANVFCALVFCPLHEALREGPEKRHKKGLDEVLFLGLFNCFPCAIDKQVTTPLPPPWKRKTYFGYNFQFSLYVQCVLFLSLFFLHLPFILCPCWA